MKDTESLVRAARAGDLAAFSGIVRKFQDMGYGCAYAILGDFHLAEDVTQEAFIEAYRNLPKLRSAAAFPAWFAIAAAGLHGPSVYQPCPWKPSRR